VYAKVLPYIWIEIRGVPYLMDFSRPTAKWMALYDKKIDWKHIEIKAI
jgi:hypothetical protein